MYKAVEHVRHLINQEEHIMNKSISKCALILCFLSIYIIPILLSCQGKKSVSLTVIPFRAIDSTSQKKDLNLSLTKGLINDFLKYKNITVISYISISKFANRIKSISEIAQELDVTIC